MKTNNNIWDKIFRKKEEVVSREIAGETILVPVRGKLADMQKIFSLNQTAEYIWQNMSGEKKLNDILEGVLSQFDVNKKEAEKDILEFITELLNADLIEEQE
ncbi:MAG: PqqD family protein [Deltaproteobacteria bacterium]|nr:PqqD family protein [Deltaproteobacteria bacterium]MBW2218285.1 PqqD family protein [Deltaproteobacteria bacterium]